uniref:S-adenosyl-L-methionine-dependent methyltransferase n=1 Tax=Magnetococcus massalia (strain MO-1) TaxID=451514 RepID=A0A1S7LJX0_MAGMO|nr:Protein of unknown function [Candidatus Magnetococcus massalia]
MKENKVSSTALTVMQGILYTAGYTEDRHLVTEPQIAACRRILQSIPEGEKRLKQLESPLFRGITPWIERLLIPGITRHYVLRKHFIETTTRELLNDGIQQLVVLGAGFDTLAWRLAQEKPDLTSIEIDHPNTSTLKQAAFADKSCPNMHFSAVDLSQEPLLEVLKADPHFDPDRPTLFICEGVMMYLPEVAIRDLLGALRHACSEPVQLIFSALEPKESANNNTSWLLKQYLTLAGEGLMWDITQDEMGAFLAQSGYTIEDAAHGHELKKRYLGEQASGPLHLGEFLVHAIAAPQALQE